MARPLLLSCQAVSKAFGTRSLFDDLSFGLFEGDQAGLVGPNGSGKSTLLKILVGTRDARPRHPLAPRRRPRRLRPPGSGLRRRRHGGRRRCWRALADVDEDDRPSRLAQALGRAGFADGRAAVDTLSGGWRKRLAIARELAAAPDILLMDEPTNHLDVDGILWLEGVLAERARACLVVSHDRYFLEHVATRMLELNRAYPDGLFEAQGRYSEFLARRDDFLRGQAAYQESLANTVRREIEWLRRGAKARATKAKGRIQEAERLIDELAESRARGVSATAGIDFTSSQRRTRRLVVARGVSKSLGGRRLVGDLDLVITPGTRVGVLGPNGSGKTTLLNAARRHACRRTRAVSSTPTICASCASSRSAAASIRRRACGARWRPRATPSSGSGQSVHVHSWAKRFLFRPEQLEVPVGRLSGGEQARILIARLMREPADLLILDEPTNDLDIPTLEVLEDSLAEFDGGLVLVTHDRFMLERVSTVILALDGQGGTATFADYAQWEAARGAAAPRAAQGGRARARAGAPAVTASRISRAARVGRHGSGRSSTRRPRSRRPSARPTIRRSPPIRSRSRSATPR